MNFSLSANPLVLMSNGTDAPVSVPSTLLPESPEHFVPVERQPAFGSFGTSGTGAGAGEGTPTAPIQTATVDTVTPQPTPMPNLVTGSGTTVSAPGGSQNQNPFSLLFPGGLPGVPGTLSGSISDAVNAAVGNEASTSGTFSASRIVTIVIGLIAIAAGIFSFKGARETIITAAKGAAIA